MFDEGAMFVVQLRKEVVHKLFGGEREINRPYYRLKRYSLCGVLVCELVHRRSTILLFGGIQLSC